MSSGGPQGCNTSHFSSPAMVCRVFGEERRQWQRGGELVSNIYIDCGTTGKLQAGSPKSTGVSSVHMHTIKIQRCNEIAF